MPLRLTPICRRLSKLSLTCRKLQKLRSQKGFRHHCLGWGSALTAAAADARLLCMQVTDVQHAAYSCCLKTLRLVSHEEQLNS